MSQYLTKYLPAQCRVYRGNLKLPEGATEQDHRQARKQFIQQVSKWQKATGWIFKVKAIGHIERPDTLHYDFIAYTDADLKPSTIKRLVGQWWGVGSFSCLEVKPHELTRECRYAWKDTKDCRKIGLIVVKDGKERKSVIYLHRRHGLAITWGSRNFYQGQDQNALWEEAKARWDLPSNNEQRTTNTEHDLQQDILTISQVLENLPSNNEQRTTNTRYPYKTISQRTLLAILPQWSEQRLDQVSQWLDGSVKRTEGSLVYMFPMWGSRGELLETGLVA